MVYLTTKYNNTEIIKFIIDKEILPINLLNLKKINPIKAAIKYEHYHILKLLYDYKIKHQKISSKWLSLFDYHEKTTLKNVLNIEIS